MASMGAFGRVVVQQGKSRHVGVSGSGLRGRRRRVQNERKGSVRVVAHTSAPVRGRREEVSASEFVSRLKLDKNSGLCSAIAQDVDSGELLMAAFATPEAVKKTLETGRATFFSRSRNELWTKGLTSGNTIDVVSVHYDCDRDCLVYLSVPNGPSCHTGAKTCFFSEARPMSVDERGSHDDISEEEEDEDVVELLEGSYPRATLFRLQDTIADRKAALDGASGSGKAGGSDTGARKPSWTAKLLQNPELLCSKVREEADELCRALEDTEGKDRVASEMADVLYHSMVLLAQQDVPLEDVMVKLRTRFGVSGIEEKASRRRS